MWIGLLLTGIAQAQIDSNLVRYTGGFDFREGLYKDFLAFRNNTPTYPIGHLTGDQGAPVTDIRKVARLYVRDSVGKSVEVSLDDMWGFCNNNVIYLRAGNGYYRIGLMGSLSHVLFEQSYRDWDPFYSPYGGGTVTRTYQAQYVLDMSDGAFKPFDASTMEVVLARDPVLKEEWDAVPKRKRGDEVLVLFLRRYNERHPLYFPK